MVDNESGKLLAVIRPNSRPFSDSLPRPFKPYRMATRRSLRIDSGVSAAPATAARRHSSNAYAGNCVSLASCCGAPVHLPGPTAPRASEPARAAGSPPQSPSRASSPRCNAIARRSATTCTGTSGIQWSGTLAARWKATASPATGGAFPGKLRKSPPGGPQVLVLCAPSSKDRLAIPSRIRSTSSTGRLSGKVARLGGRKNICSVAAVR